MWSCAMDKKRRAWYTVEVEMATTCVICNLYKKNGVGESPKDIGQDIRSS